MERVRLQDPIKRVSLAPERVKLPKPHHHKGMGAKGHAKMGGRKSGTLNYYTREIKDALLRAAEMAGSNGKGKDGMVGYFLKLAKNNEAVFAGLLGRLIPYQLQAAMAVTHEHTHAVKFDFNDLVKRDPRELADLYFEQASSSATVPERSRPTSH